MLSIIKEAKESVLDFHKEPQKFCKYNVVQYKV